jgi:adenylate kinase family enzyme
MNRVAVIGSPGAGKTTFSKKLAAKLRIPLYHLDYFYYDDTFNYPENTAAWREKVTQLTDQPAWILDGNYKSTFDIRFPKADTIIYLDYPRSLAVTRALKRRVKLHGKLRSDMPPSWKEKFTFALFRFIWSYNKNERPKVYGLLQKYAGKKVIILRSPAQADEFLTTLRHG